MRWLGTEAAGRRFDKISSKKIKRTYTVRQGRASYYDGSRCWEYCVSWWEGKSSWEHPHNNRAVVWHVLAVDDLESGEEGPDSPVGEPSYNPVGDVGFGHVDDGARQEDLSDFRL